MMDRHPEKKTAGGSMVRRVLPEEVELCPHTAAVAGHLEVATHPGQWGLADGAWESTSDGLQ